MSESYDAIVIGAGHNGLVAAAYMVRAGLNVLVLESRETLGGAASVEEVVPGYQFSAGADEAALLVPEIVDDLHLRHWGLEFHETPAAITALNPAGRALTLWKDLDQTLLEIGRNSKADQGKFSDFVDIISKFGSLVSRIRKLPPPEIGQGLDPRQALPWAYPALQLRRMGGDDMMAFLRLLPMSAAEFLSEYFEGDLILGALGALSVRGSFAGPMAAGTAFQFLYNAPSSGLLREAEQRFVRGGIGGLISALASAVQAHRGVIKTGQKVDRVIVREGQAKGVVLDSGEEIPGKTIVSSVGPRVTYLDLIGAHQLPLNVVRKVKNIRFRGSTSKVNLALSSLPDFDGIEGLDKLKGWIYLSPSLEYLERAYDAAKYGRFSSRPALEIVIPSLLDSHLAPPGGHVMSISARYTPYHLRDSNWDEQREGLGDQVVEMLTEVVPNIQDKIVGRQILTPLDLELRFALTEGSIYQGQMDLDQLLFMRPIPGFSRYRSPIGGLYLCGAGTHPGGGISGAPGYNAAREIHSDWMRT